MLDINVYFDMNNNNNNKIIHGNLNVAKIAQK